MQPVVVLDIYEAKIFVTWFIQVKWWKWFYAMCVANGCYGRRGIRLLLVEQNVTLSPKARLAVTYMGVLGRV